MDPAKPPLPTPCNFPFQPEAGSHTSNSIWESLEGWMTPVTLQKAGKLGIAGDLGGVNEPAGMDCAEVIVVAGRLSCARLSHVAAAAGALVQAIHAPSAIAVRDVSRPKLLLNLILSAIFSPPGMPRNRTARRQGGAASRRLQSGDWGST
jgi:hypothetical protein